MENEKLLPCPFCGGEARAILVREVGWVYRIYCPKCRMSEKLAYNREKEELEKLIPKFIEEWNTRSYPPEVQDAICREKPFKPEKRPYLYEGKFRECKCEFIVRKYMNFCPNCGQKLDWSDYA